MCLDDSMMPRGFKWEIERGVCVCVGFGGESGLHLEG